MFRDRGTAIAQDIIGGDDVMDGYHRASYELINSQAWHGTTQDVVNLVLLARYFERFGDHCVSLAKRLIYIAPASIRTACPTRTARTTETRDHAQNQDAKGLRHPSWHRRPSHFQQTLRGFLTSAGFSKGSSRAHLPWLATAFAPAAAACGSRYSPRGTIGLKFSSSL